MTMPLKTWISEIEISGLAGSDQTIKYKLNSDINLFFGANGSGKTSLLKIINAASIYDETDVSDIPFHSAKITFTLFEILHLERTIENTSFIQKERQQTNIQLQSDQLRTQTLNSVAASAIGNLLSADKTGKLEAPLKWKTNAYIIQKDGTLSKYDVDDENAFILQNQFLPTSRLYLGLVPQNTWQQKQVTERELEQNFTERIKELWKEYNYELSKTEAKAQARGLAKILEDVWSESSQSTENKDIILEQAYERVIKFLSRQEVDSEKVIKSFEKFRTRIDTQPSLKKIIKDINDVEEAIEKAMIPKTKFKEIIKKLYGDKVQLAIEEKGITAKNINDKDISLGALSSGQKHLLMILLSTLLADAKPIIIDEPEISMNVDWQSELVPIMQELMPSAQIIIATHSPEIAASVNDDKLFRL